MICPRCGATVADDVKFCTECGANLDTPQSQPQAQAQPQPQAQPQLQAGGPEKKKTNVALIVVIAIVAILVIFVIAAVVLFNRFKAAYNDISTEMKYELDPSEMPKVPDAPDIDGLNDAAEAIADLDLDTDIDTEFDVPTVPEVPDDITEEDVAPDDVPAGDKTVYGFTDVYRMGNDITVIPNGGLDGSTVLFGGKDLDGFLDYVDSTVLEKGRKINRDFFYDMLSVMNVDEELTSDTDDIKMNMIMALALANNFHDIDVRINSCELDADNAADYHLNVTAQGTDNTWIVNFNDRTLYMNDGKTEYSSDMFKNDYLALWLVAIEEYYGL